MLLAVAGLQTMYGQKVVVNKADGTYISYDVSTLNSIELYEVGTWLVRKIVLSDTHVCLIPDEMKALTASVIPEDADNQALTWESSDEEVAEVTKNGKVITNTSGDCTITCYATDGSGVKTTCEVHVMATGTSGTTNGHDWIDLGLPSGTKWATCNVGADSPEEYGNYYAWGETTTKSNYDWNTYKWCKGDTFTKYCNDSGSGYNGFTDNITELLPEDDAATVNWGNNWQMPTLEQCGELLDTAYILTVWTQVNKVSGYRFISKNNGNSIFLPKVDNTFTSSSYTDRCWYWTRSLSFGSSRAWSLGIVPFAVYMNELMSRSAGLVIRPVRKQ